jgi:hypothetical protein
MKNDESRTRKHNNAQDGEEVRITVVSPEPKPGDKRFHPVFGSDGKRVRRVYFRVRTDGSKAYYARIVDPKTGEETWRSSPDGSVALAKALVSDSEKAVGEMRANAYHEALGVIRQRQEGWTIDRLLKEYPKAAEARRAAVGKPSLATQRTQLGRARRILKGHENENVSRVPELVLAYAVRWNREHGGVPTVTAAGEAQQVRAVFAPWVLEACERAGMPHTELRWREIAQPAFQYELPPKELRERTIAAGKEEIAKGTDVGMAFMLEFFCAMSAADAIRARWDWLGPDDTVRYARHKTAKCAAPRIPPEVASRWRELAAKADSPFVLPFAAPSRRHSFLLKDFADWMTALGWTTKKKGHELRKLMCSIWYTTPGIGAEWTQAWSGDSLEVLQKHYARLLPEKAPPAPNV